MVSLKLFWYLYWHLLNTSPNSIKVKLKQVSQMLFHCFYCWLWKRNWPLGNASETSFIRGPSYHPQYKPQASFQEGFEPKKDIWGAKWIVFDIFWPFLGVLCIMPSTAIEIHPPFSGFSHKVLGEIRETVNA